LDPDVTATVPGSERGALDTAQPRHLPGGCAEGPAENPDDPLSAPENPASEAGAEPRTVGPTTPHGLALKAQSDRLVANTRGTHARRARVSKANVHGLSADVIPLTTRAPVLEHPPTTRTVVEKGIVTVQLSGKSLLELLGWSSGALKGSLDGTWVLLTRDVDGPGPRRHDGRSTVHAIGKLRVSAAVLHQVGVAVDQEISLLVLPEHGALGLCHPSRLLTAVAAR
jgi:hypothetical protein